MKPVNRNLVRHVFDQYVSHYNADDPKIALKIEHTYKVADLCETIAASLSLSEEQIDIAWLCGMLHDIGRFEQIRRYGTFMDAASIDHALLSAQILFGANDQTGMIRRFIDNADQDETILHAVRWHSAYRLPDDLSGWPLTCAQILRDADKIDIFRVNRQTPLEDIYNVTTKELLQSSITPDVMDSFNAHHAVERSLKKTPIDHVIGHICLAYELVYPKSRTIALAQGYLGQLLCFHSENASANEQMAYIKEHMLTWLQQH